MDRESGTERFPVKVTPFRDSHGRQEKSLFAIAHAFEPEEQWDLLPPVCYRDQNSKTTATFFITVLIRAVMLSQL
jgi:hypothetical protein